MDYYHLIVDYRDLMEHFNRYDYPEYFQRYACQVQAVIARTPDHAAAAEEFTAALEQNWSTVRGKNRRRIVRDTDRMLLSCYFNPAALTFPEGAELVAAIQDAWDRRFPDFSYRIGTYEKIMEGFEPRLLGIKISRDSD